MPTVMLYTKPGCHLCEEVKEVIDHVRQSRPFELIVRNILDDVEDYERYKELIPVVLVDGREVGRYRLTEADLIRFLVPSPGTPGEG